MALAGKKKSSADALVRWSGLEEGWWIRLRRFKVASWQRHVFNIKAVISDWDSKGGFKYDSYIMNLEPFFHMKYGQNKCLVSHFHFLLTRLYLRLILNLTNSSLKQWNGLMIPALWVSGMKTYTAAYFIHIIKDFFKNLQIQIDVCVASPPEVNNLVINEP